MVRHITSKQRIASVVKLFKGSVRVHTIPMGHGNSEGDAGHADIIYIMMPLSEVVHGQASLVLSMLSAMITSTSL